MGRSGRRHCAAHCNFHHMAACEESRHPGIYRRQRQLPGRRGQVDTARFLAVDDAFAIGADEDGMAVFKNPARALRALRTHYGEGIWAIQKELYMLPLTPYTYNLYGMYGWQLTEGTEEELRQARFVTGFVDIYENSFQ